MKLVYQYMAIFFIFSLTSSHHRPLQVENCNSNLRLVVDEDDNGKFRPERVNSLAYINVYISHKTVFVILKKNADGRLVFLKSVTMSLYMIYYDEWS